MYYAFYLITLYSIQIYMIMINAMKRCRIFAVITDDPNNALQKNIMVN